MSARDTGSLARSLSFGLGATTHVLGAAAFLYPFFLPRRPGGGETAAHASEAPVLFGLLAALALAVAVAEMRRGALDARRIALLGVLSGMNAVLRLPGSVGGASPMFLLPILCGYVFGAGFGFMLGAWSMAVSGVLTGGVGPWLPFQMWAMGWVGAGGSLARPFRSWGGLPALAAYSWAAGMLFGAVMNLWSWPFLSGGSPEMSWQAGIGTAEALRRYWRFYVVTSLAWDGARATGNVVLMLVLGRPVIRLLERFRARLGRAAPVLDSESETPTFGGAARHGSVLGRISS
ncbi:MAG: ECF transporter S component [Acidobacteria bacterium]|nr:ECF transporter S component [Acidobacteriota bacterium]